MIQRHYFRRTASLLFAAFLLGPLSASGQQTPEAAPAQQALSPSSLKALTPSEFAGRLGAFDQTVAACEAGPSAEHCQASQVDAGLQLQLPSGIRSVSFLWLRAILDEAAHPPKTEAGKPGKPKLRPGGDEEQESLSLDRLPPIHDRLDSARKRLIEERAEALAVQPAASQPTGARHALAAILTGQDYHAINPNRTLRQRILEKIQGWLIRFFRSITEAGRGKRWIGIAAEVTFLAVLLIVLFWFLIRLERRGRLASASLAPGLGAASARDWQLWLDDARQAAAGGAWRNAVHYLYWSSISRLESSGLWPADRARTPREYLALLGPGHAQRAALLALTRTFERTWYAGRPASEADFQQAEQQAGQLAVRRGEWQSGRRQADPQDGSEQSEKAGGL